MVKLSLKDTSNLSWRAFNCGDYDAAISIIENNITGELAAQKIAYMTAFARFAKGQIRQALYGLSLRRLIIKDPFIGALDWSLTQAERPTLIWAPPGIGVGAEIMHLGFLQNFKSIPLNYSFAIDPRLVPRIKVMYPKLTVSSRDTYPDNLRPDTLVTTIMSLGYMAYQMNGAILPRKKRILGASSVAVKRLRNGYISSSNEKLIGISWRSGRGNIPSRDFSITQAYDVAKTLSSSKKRYISLQHDLTPDEKDECISRNIIIPNAEQITGSLSNFCDILATCDDGVSAANSTIHFAGALAKPFTLLRRSNCPWEWRPKCAKRFWYPEIRFANFPALV